ncbi:MAG: CHAT domain-containing protein [Planctomycetaceae bacterium]
MRAVALASCLALLLAPPAAGQVVVPPVMGVPGRAPVVPTAGHDLALEALAAGDYAAALDLAGREYQGGVKIGAERWIDTIASAALLGECLFELGRLGEAMARYEESLLTFATHRDWLLDMQFPQQPLQPRNAPRIATWTRSERNAAPAAIPDVVAIRQRAADPQQVLQRGGVLAADFDRPVRPQEIARSLVIAIYRHRDLLGSLAPRCTGLDAAAKALALRKAPPNHWSQSWIDVALGTVFWAQGRNDQAGQLLTRGLAAGNGLDHGLTSWGLIVLGRLALDSDTPQQAARLFEEATVSAADFGDARALEEAFRLAAIAHAVAGTRGVPPSIRDGCAWAEGRSPALRARLLAIEAERLAATRDLRSASAALADIEPRLLRGDAGRSRIGGAASYAAAVIEYAAGRVEAGDGRLADAIAIARPYSPRLFQTARLVDLLRAGSDAVSNRDADALFGTLLADPASRDVAADPLDALTTLATPRGAAFDAWLVVAERRGVDAAIEAAEARTRHRWMASQPLGGRRLAVDRLLAADPRALAETSAARRAALLGGHPELAEVVDRLGQARGGLAAALAAAAGGAAVPAAAHADAEAFAALATRRAQIVAEIAACRDPIPIDFPPLTVTAEIRRRLPPRHLILSFHQGPAGLVGMLESRDRSAVWKVRQAGGLPEEMKSLAKGLCLFDPVAAVPLAKLADGDWQGSAERIERMLFENSKITLAEGIEELVIVPDGWLWYLPFELLPVASSRAAGDDAADATRLRDVCRIRYAPSRSLAVQRCEEHAAGVVGVHAGRMVRSDKPADADAVHEHLVATVERVAPLRAGGPVPLGVAAAVCDTLAVFDELAGAGPVAAWPLVPGASGQKPLTFGDWLASPVKRPQRVLLPGLQTPLADGLDKPPAQPGEELFVAATDLLAAGARTAVLSRWRTGGKSCLDLMTEFLRESQAAEPVDASSAWQRAVDLVIAEEPDVVREPRLKAADAPLAAPLHPLLWAGYMLIDCGRGTLPDDPPAVNPPAAGATP